MNLIKQWIYTMLKAHSFSDILPKFMLTFYKNSEKYVLRKWLLFRKCPLYCILTLGSLQTWLQVYANVFHDGYVQLIEDAHDILNNWDN